MINLGASSDNLMIKAETDLGPRVSFELNSLFPSSLVVCQSDFRLAELNQVNILQNLIRKLRVIILLRENVKELGHRL